MLRGIDRMMARNRNKIPPEQFESQRKSLTSEVLKGIGELVSEKGVGGPLTQSQKQRRALVQSLLKQQIETKLIYLDARKTIPEENFPNVEQQLAEQFDAVAAKGLMEQAGVKTWRELDEYLRGRGSSLDRERQAFTESAVAQQWIREQVKPDEEVSYDQMAEYYRQHPSEFDEPALTRWQQLMVRFSRYPGKAEARAAVAKMGNRVLNGADFAEVAKAHSHGPTASEGGIRRWPTKSLVSEAVKSAVVGLPVGQLSPILEDWRGLHIIRVVERRPARRLPFVEAQGKIRKKIKRQRTQQQLQAYVSGVQKKIPVWTIFDQRPDQRLSGRGGPPQR